MLILAVFFLAFSDAQNLQFTSNFNPEIHPTIADLSVPDSETISYIIKQRQTKLKKATSFTSSTSHHLSSCTTRFYLPFTSLSYPLFFQMTTFLLHVFGSKNTSYQFTFKQMCLQKIIPVTHSTQGQRQQQPQNVSQQQIQILGLWYSDAFKSYIRWNRFHTKKTHQALLIKHVHVSQKVKPIASTLFKL